MNSSKNTARDLNKHLWKFIDGSVFFQILHCFFTKGFNELFDPLLIRSINN